MTNLEGKKNIPKRVQEVTAGAMNRKKLCYLLAELPK